MNIKCYRRGVKERISMSYKNMRIKHFGTDEIREALNLLLHHLIFFHRHLLPHFFENNTNNKSLIIIYKFDLVFLKKSLKCCTL